MILEFGFQVDSCWELCIIHDIKMDLILFWYDYVFNCSITANAGNQMLIDIDSCITSCNDTKISYFMCHGSDMDTLHLTQDSVNSKYGMDIMYDSLFPVKPSKLFVIDLFGNKYVTDTLCGPSLYASLWTNSIGDDAEQLCNYQSYNNLQLMNISVCLLK